MVETVIEHLIGPSITAFLKVISYKHFTIGRERTQKKIPKNFQLGCAASHTSCSETALMYARKRPCKLSVVPLAARASGRASPATCPSSL